MQLLANKLPNILLKMKETKPNLVIMATGWTLKAVTSLDYANLDSLCEAIKLDANKSVAKWIVAMEYL